jgi:hypothetical protein
MGTFGNNAVFRSELVNTSVISNITIQIYQMPPVMSSNISEILIVNTKSALTTCLLSKKYENLTNWTRMRYMGLSKKEAVDAEAKTALEDSLLPTEKYPPQDLINWIKTKTSKRNEKLKKRGTGYPRAIYDCVINRQENKESHFYNFKLTVDQKQRDEEWRYK